MDTSYLYTKTGEQLKLLAKQAGVKLPSGAPKAKIIALLSEALEKKEAEAVQPNEAEPTAPEKEKPVRGRKKAPKAESATLKTAKDEAPQAEATNDAAASVQEQAAEKPAAPRKRGRPAGTKNKPAPKASAKEVEADAAAQTAEQPSVTDSAEAQPKAVQEAPVQLEKPAQPDAETAQEASAQPEIPAPGAPIAEEVNEAEEKQPLSTIQEAEKGVPSGDWGEGSGVLEILPDGYGFLRADNCLPGTRDVYLSQTQIRRFNLRNGDFITGKTRPQRDGDRYEGMIYVSTVNGASADAARRRPRFEDLTPIFPNARLRLENPLGNTDLALRTIDLIAPIGKGQRGLIVSPPKAGKTVLLKLIANAIHANYPDVKLMILLIDERPEEVTDMQRSTHGDVFYSTFDEAPENHTRLSEMVLDCAQRQVEMGKDVVILLDSITRLARAYNLVIPPTGRSLSGGLDPGALLKPKKFFGAARNIEFGGSLTIIATALVDTGSRLDDIIYEEFKGTGNMELHLDRRLSERRVFPAIDINRSGTRRDDLLYTPQEAEGALQIRRSIASGSTQDATEQLMMLMEKTANNEQLTARIKGWLTALSK
ncbi:MAG: transcription termination factor Rho [Clostridia bacterium]|nr:transcription termination factor Rho [Clostridia bacterium]